MPLEKDALDALRMDREHTRQVAHRRAMPFLALGIALLLLLLLVSAWWVLRPESVRVETVVALAMDEGRRPQAATVLNASGYVVARRVATVASRVTGQITDVAIEEGMRVSRGDVLARLDDTIAQAELALAESRLETTRRTEAEIRIRLEEAGRNHERTRRLRERDLASESSLDAARAEVQALEARLAVVRSEVLSAERSLALVQRNLEETVIRAPFDGVVVSKNAQPGETISPMSAGGFTRTGIATIVDMNSLEIEVDVNEAFITRVKSGQPVRAVLDAYSDWSIPARVIGIVPTADRQRATVRVRVGIEEPDPRILPEMGVQVWFLESDDPQENGVSDRFAVLVPDRAIRGGEGNEYLFIVSEGRLERRAVQLGRQRGGRIEILAGLHGGERVVVQASGELADGMPVVLADNTGG